MNASSSNTAAVAEHHAPTVTSPVPAERAISSAELFLRFAVVVLGIVLGAIGAIFIGLFTRWIQIGC